MIQCILRSSGKLFKTVASILLGKKYRAEIGREKKGEEILLAQLHTLTKRVLHFWRPFTFCSENVLHLKQTICSEQSACTAQLRSQLSVHIYWCSNQCASAGMKRSIANIEATNGDIVSFSSFLFFHFLSLCFYRKKRSSRVLKSCTLYKFEKLSLSYKNIDIPHTEKKCSTICVTRF